MARIQHLAIASRDPFKQAEFYKRVFGFEEVRRLDNPRAKGVVLTDGHLNISVLQFQQDQLDHGLDFTGLHHFGVYVEDLEGTAKKCLENGCVPLFGAAGRSRRKSEELPARSAPTNSKARRTRCSTSPTSRGSVRRRRNRVQRGWAVTRKCLRTALAARTSCSHASRSCPFCEIPLHHDNPTGVLPCGEVLEGAWGFVDLDRCA